LKKDSRAAESGIVKAASGIARLFYFNKAKNENPPQNVHAMLLTGRCMFC
jgi:hypothetical protein